MKNCKGSALVEYIIPTAVIAIVVGLGIFLLMDNNKLLNFITNSNNAKYDSDKLKLSSQGKPDAPTKDMVLAPQNYSQGLTDWMVAAGQLKGTPDNPANQCVGNSCSLDYGPLVLNGIPANFDSFVETVGTSGGTTKLASLIDEILAQAKNLDPPMDDDLIRQLSNQGHGLASSQKATEDYVKTLYNTGSAPALINQMMQLQIKQTSALAMNQQIQDTLDKINQKYSNPANQNQSNILNTVNVLGKNILDKNAQYSSMVMSTVGLGIGQASAAMTNPILSISASSMVQAQAQSLLHPQFSQGTNVNSSLICATGKYSDDGKTCK